MISSAVFSCLIAEVTFKIYLGSNSRAMADREKKKAKMETQKKNYLKNEKSFLDEIRNICQGF